MIGDERSTAERVFRSEGLDPELWSNLPGYRYEEHTHRYHKVLFCIAGSITFHTPDGEVTLAPGDRLDLPPETPHAATVGSDGVTCIEAYRV